ncbi:MAG: hemerythrin domain-containing protein [Ottowia sp.]|uniref:hemerythrin domain-containing protein n=1 Tax=unclassified Ottowia TaxID=2645081 RepID=UPI003C2EA553
MTSTTLLPGFNAPAVGFEQPFEMLEACHERVQRSLGLLERLLAHIDANGHDASSRSAAADVLRYFDIAAPHHHEDEERHVFPALAGSQDDRIHEAVARLKSDHARMDFLWARLRRVLLAWRDDQPAPLPTAADRALVRDFALCYADHIPLEETLVYPAARALFDAGRLTAIGEEMASRRRAS